MIPTCRTLREMEEVKIPTMESVGHSEVAEWYRDKTVFVTGGTGFMGKVLVEKLLRSCPVKKIYMLIRPKGADVRQRVDDMFNYKLFGKLKACHPEYLLKVVPMKGDITLEGLGLSDDDEALLANEVNVVFHAAASINFQEPMRVAVNMNMLGTKRVLSLAKKMSNLESFVHVSTAYANCHLYETYEELYPASIDPSRLIQLTEWFDDEVLKSLTPQLIQPRPNTYTFTKALAEHILVNDAGNIPVSIVRPSIVCGAWREPEPGWVDNMFAFTGLLIAMGKGVLRSLYIKKGIRMDFIPVDMPINLMIASAYNTAAKKFRTESSVPIFCSSTGTQNPLTVSQLKDIIVKVAQQNPQEHALWYPNGTEKENKFMHTLHIFCTNYVPAYIIDFVMKLIGKKQIAVKLCNKMVKAIDVLEYFMTRDWTFHNDNVQGLWAAISPVDRHVFHFDVGDLNWQDYINSYQTGCKKFILNEGCTDVDIANAQKNMRWKRWIHRMVQLLFLYITWCLVSSDICVAGLLMIGRQWIKIVSFSPMMVAAEEENHESVFIEDIHEDLLNNNC